jgi:hypothetical protein
MTARAAVEFADELTDDALDALADLLLDQLERERADRAAPPGQEPAA